MVFRVGGSNPPTAPTNRTAAQSPDWHPAPTQGIRLFLVVSRFEADHALTYLFCEGAISLDRVQALVNHRRDTFRGSNVVVELAEAYFSLAQAEQRALALRTWLTNVNVIFPPLRIG